jgi:hypothetical protein
MKDLKATRQRFRSIHDGFFVIPNAWNVGEIRQLEKLDFGAIATTSAGLSASMGRDDLSLSRDETLQNIRTLCAGTDLPVNADFESGFADDAPGVGANVAMAAEAGVCGLSIEDRKGGALYDLKDAVARIKAARAALDKIDPNIVLVGRPEGYLIGNSDVRATIERLKAYADAGRHQGGRGCTGAQTRQHPDHPCRHERQGARGPRRPAHEHRRLPRGRGVHRLRQRRRRTQKERDSPEGSFRLSLTREPEDQR